MAVEHSGTGKPHGGVGKLSPLGVTATVIGGLGGLIFLIEAARGAMRAWTGSADEFSMVVELIVVPMLLGAIVAAIGVWFAVTRQQVGGVILLAEGIFGLLTWASFIFYPIWGAPFLLLAGILALIASRPSGRARA